MIRRRIFVCTILLLLSMCWQLSNLQGASQAQDEKTWLLNQINNLRATVGIHAYVWNDQLAAAAQQHSEYMASTGDISHTQANGSTPATRAAANGYGGSWVIENIYGGGLATAADAWNFWINSSIHYSGLVNTNTNEIGIGIASGVHGNFYTLVFGKGNINPPPAQPIVDTSSIANNSSAVEEPAPNTSNDVIVPTRRPPPTRTFTPSPTVPTFTPSPTWTFTPVWTATFTPTNIPPSATPIVLPTVVAVMPTFTPTIYVERSATVETNQKQVKLSSGQENESVLRRFLPYLIVGQIVLIGLGLGSMMFRRE